MTMNLEAMKEWKRFFESTGKDVFDLLESTINVAARYHPDEFFKRRDRIAQLLFTRQQQQRGFNIHDDVSEEEDTTTHSSDFSDMALRKKEHRAEGCVFASKKSTCASKPDSEIVISDSEKCPASGIGMGTEEKEPKPRHIIRIKLRPKPNKEEQFPTLDKAKSQVADDGEQKPLALEKEKETETKCDAEVKLPVPHRVPKKSCTKAAEAGIVTRKFSEKSNERKIAAEVGIATEKFLEKSGQRKITEKIKEQKPRCSDFEVKLEASKRKLHERYNQFEDAKQKKKIRMIEFKDLSRGGVSCRPVNYVRSNKGRLMNRIRSSWTR